MGKKINKLTTRLSSLDRPTGKKIISFKQSQKIAAKRMKKYPKANGRNKSQSYQHSLKLTSANNRHSKLIPYLKIIYGKQKTCLLNQVTKDENKQPHSKKVSSDEKMDFVIFYGIDFPNREVINKSLGDRFLKQIQKFAQEIQGHQKNGLDEIVIRKCYQIEEIVIFLRAVQFKFFYQKKDFQYLSNSGLKIGQSEEIIKFYSHFRRQFRILKKQYLQCYPTNGVSQQVQEQRSMERLQNYSKQKTKSEEDNNILSNKSFQII